MLSRTSWFRLRSVRAPKTGRRARLLGRTLQPHLEQLEDRCVPSSTYLVTNFADSNTPGTLRFAINQANANHTGTAASPDQIQFTTGAGTIGVAGTPLAPLAANEVVVL